MEKTSDAAGKTTCQPKMGDGGGAKSAGGGMTTTTACTSSADLSPAGSRRRDTMENGSTVADLSLADFGRRELNLAEVEMPGLMQIRREFAASQPLRGARITGSLHATVQTGVLVETLKALGADLRWCSCNIFSTQDHAAAALARDKSCTIFAWKGETLEEYWECSLKALTWPVGQSDTGGPSLLVDDGGDITLMIHEGVKAETHFEKTGTLPDPESTQDAELKIVYKILRRELEKDPRKWRKMAAGIAGVSEETTTGVHRLVQMAAKSELLFPAINVNDCVTKSKFDNVYGCRHSLPDAIMRATDVLIGGKKVLVCGFGDVGKGCAQAMKGCGARVFVTEVDPICALQACMEGFEVVSLDQVVNKVDIFVTATGNRDIIMFEDMKRMKNNAIVCNIGHFDNEIDMAGLQRNSAVVRETIKPQVDRFVFLDTKHGVIVLAEGRLCNLGCATGHPSFVMSCSFANQTLAQIDLWQHRKGHKYAKPSVYLLDKALDEKVAALHLEAFGATLTKLTPQQAAYISVSPQGPFKPATYRY